MLKLDSPTRFPAAATSSSSCRGTRRSGSQHHRFSDRAGTVVIDNDALSVGGNGKSTTFSGVIEDGSDGLGELVKVGAGVLTLSGQNSYSGGTEIKAGAIKMLNELALGSNPVTVDSGVSLEVSNDILDSGQAITLDGFGLVNAGALKDIATTPNTNELGAITLGSNASIICNSAQLFLSSLTGTNNASITFGGAGGIGFSSTVALGGGGVTKNGSGTVVLAGLETVYSGATLVTGGVLEIVDGFLSGAVALTGGTLQFDNDSRSSRLPEAVKS